MAKQEFMLSFQNKQKQEREFEEKLINLVKSNPILYDFRYDGHKNIKRRNAVWKNISKELNADVPRCKGKWKCLRDSYRRSFLSSGSLVVWKWKEQLSFLEGFQNVQFSKSRMLEDDSDDDKTDDIEEMDLAISQMITEYAAKQKREPSLEADDKIREDTHFEACGIDDYDNQFESEDLEDNRAVSPIRVTEAKKQKIETKYKDDELFLLSLAPKMKALTDQAKFDVQIQFLQILKDATNSKSN